MRASIRNIGIFWEREARTDTKEVFMLNNELLREVLGVAMSSGGDFAEIYAEHTRSNNIQFVDGKIDKINDNVISGVGIRIFLGQRTVYASTSDITREGLLACARSAADALGEGKASISICLNRTNVIDIHPVEISPVGAQIGTKTDILKRACFSAKSHSNLISQVSGTLLCVEREILVANTEGLLVGDNHTRTRIAVSAVASDGVENQSGSSSPGRSMGLEMFDFISPEETE